VAGTSGPTRRPPERLEAALSLQCPPSSVVGIRARALACRIAGSLKCRADPVAAQRWEQQALMLFQEIGDTAGVAEALRIPGAVNLVTGDLRKAGEK
jgi:hypothetical protein